MCRLRPGSLAHGLVWLAALPLAGCGLFAGAEELPTPNVLWIMMDDCRADALSCYGRPWARTPHMDDIARRGVRFDVAVVQNPVCVPSRASMKTSRYPHALGIMAMGKPAEIPPRYPAPENPPPPNLLGLWTQAGIQPVSVGKRHFAKEAWEDRGDVPPLIDFRGGARSPELAARMEEHAGESDFPAVKTKTHGWQIGGVLPIEPEESQTGLLGDEAVAVLRELVAREEPFFLRVSFHAPHVACSVPPAFLIDPATIHLPLPTDEELASKPRFERERLHVYAGGLDLDERQIGIARGTYYGMVSEVDAQVGRLVEVLEEAGELDRTVIAINSDQGFGLGEHGLWKKRAFYEQNVRVPFVLSAPDRLPGGEVVADPVEMVDFMPTLLELSGLEVPEGVAGRSLVPLIRGDEEGRTACFAEIDHARSMYPELRGTGRRVMVRTERWKMVIFLDDRVADEDGCLYGLENDPGETTNLFRAKEHEPVVRELRELARGWAGLD